MSATPKVAVSDVKAALVARVGDGAVTTASEDLDAYTARAEAFGARTLEEYVLRTRSVCQCTAGRRWSA